MIEKRFQGSLESDLSLNLFHLLPDSRDLFQADPVNFVGGKIGGSVSSNQELVGLISAGKTTQADFVGCGRQVRPLQKFDYSYESWSDLGGYRLLGTLSKFEKFRFCRPLLPCLSQRLVKRTLFRILV